MGAEAGELSIIEAPSTAADLVAKLVRLRVRAWATQVPVTLQNETWLDEFDLVARHWAAFWNGEPSVRSD